MIKRWLRRRLGVRTPDVEAKLRDEERGRGSLVRKGELVTLRTHVSANREAFQRWYGDPEIAALLRHDLEPLTAVQSRGYFDTFIMPASARGICFAIHERKTKRLIGTTALTDQMTGKQGVSALFRIVIGEKDLWGNGYGTDATRLVVEEGFDALGLNEVRLEVFGHNARAIAAYRRVGFSVTGEHVEWVPRQETELRVIEMSLSREAFEGQENLPSSRRTKPRHDAVSLASEDRASAREARRADRKAARRAARVASAKEALPRDLPGGAPAND